MKHTIKRNIALLMALCIVFLASPTFADSIEIEPIILGNLGFSAEEYYAGAEKRSYTSALFQVEIVANEETGYQEYLAADNPSLTEIYVSIDKDKRMIATYFFHDDMLWFATYLPLINSLSVSSVPISEAGFDAEEYMMLLCSNEIIEEYKRVPTAEHHESFLQLSKIIQTQVRWADSIDRYSDSGDINR